MKRVAITAVIGAMLVVAPAAAEAKSTRKVQKIVTRYAQSQGYAVSYTFCDRITRRMWSCSTGAIDGSYNLHSTVRQRGKHLYISRLRYG